MKMGPVFSLEKQPVIDYHSKQKLTDNLAGAYLIVCHSAVAF